MSSTVIVFVLSSTGTNLAGLQLFRHLLSWPAKAATRTRTSASAMWMKMLLRFMVVPLNPIILAFEFVSPDLVLVRAIFEGLTLGFELDAPAARHHLAAHFVVFCC